MVCCFVGLLVCWSAGLLVCWFVGCLIRPGGEGLPSLSRRPRTFRRATLRLRIVDPIQICFMSFFVRCLVAPALISETFGSKMSPWMVDFRRFFENRGFLEIELSIVIWPHFEGRTFPKRTLLQCENRLPCATAEKRRKEAAGTDCFRPRA